MLARSPTSTLGRAGRRRDRLVGARRRSRACRTTSWPSCDELPGGQPPEAVGRAGDQNPGHDEGNYWPWTTPRSPNAWTRSRLLLELVEANPYTIRAYRRAAETIRGRGRPGGRARHDGRVRELRGIGPGIEARLRELVETGEIAELAELERELSPELVGLGRYLGLTAQRSIELARALGIHTADELREAAAAGRLRDVPGHRGEDRGAAARRAGPRARAATARAGSSSTAPASWWARVAGALGAEVAGDVAPLARLLSRLAVVCAARDPRADARALRAAAADRRGDRARPSARRSASRSRASPIRLVVADADRRSAQRWCARPARAAYVAALEPLPDAPDEHGVYDALGVPWCPPELREQPFARRAAAARRARQIRGDLHSHTTWSDGRRRSRRWAARPATVAMSTWRSAITRRRWARCAGSPPTTCAARARRSPPPTRRSRRSACCAESSATSSPDGRLDLPDDVLAELDWVQASVHGGQRMPRREMTERVQEALRNPYVRCLSHPTGPLHQPPARERAGPRAGLRGRARGRGRAGGQRPAPSPRPVRRARARRPARRRRARLLDRRALDRGAGQHDVLGGDRPARLGDRGGRPQHAAARSDPRVPRSRASALTRRTPPRS